MRANKKAAPSGANAGSGNGIIAAGGCIVIPASELYHYRQKESRVYRMTDIFDEVKQRVTTEEAAEFYGFHLNRGRYICCPFHGEKTPSLKIYSGSGGWCCFGCHAGGSVIDFTARLFNLDAMGAVRRLDQDFRLNLPLDRSPNRGEREQVQRRRELMDTRKMYELWRERMLLMLNTSYRVGHLALRDKTPAAWTEAEVTAVKWLDALADWADALDGSTAEQIAVFRERKGVERLCGRILANWSLTKSLTA